jgi:hypothetical protein
LGSRGYDVDPQGGYTAPAQRSEPEPCKPTYKAICVFDEEAAFRSAEAHMLHFARIAVPRFLC